ncbi:MAG: adenylate kinase [Opitutus sp.]
MNIAIIGPSGVGKGSQAAGLCARFRLRHVATGDLFRDNLQSHSALGIVARKYMEQGELVPDEIVDAMIEEWLIQLPPERGTLFDGFPRTLAQARFLDELLGRFDRALDAVVYLQVADEEIIRRLAGRFICRSCQTPYHQQTKPPEVYGVCDECGGELYHRPDDSTELTHARLRVFHRTVGPVLDYYSAARKLVIISGEESIGEVDARLVRALEGVRNRTYGFATPQEVLALPRIIEAQPTPAHLARPTLDIVLFGAPGSGKGTQAEQLCREFNLPHIATGDLFRDNLRRETELGKLAKTYMNHGELVPDDVTDAMVEDRLIQPDARDGCVLDGYPRNLHQAQALMDIMDRQQRRLSGVLYINVGDEAIVQRLSGRMICEKCQAPYHSQYKPPRAAGVCDHCGGALYQRPDDSPSTVRARLVTFHNQTEPLIEFYRSGGLLLKVNGEDAPKEVTAASVAAVRSILPDSKRAPAPSEAARL